MIGAIVAGGLSAPTAPVTNSYESIMTGTLVSAGTISFTSIPSTYKHLQIRYMANNETAANYKIGLRFNNDTSSNYYWHYIEGAGSGTPSAGAADEYTAARMGKANYSTSYWSAGVIDLLDYADTNKYKTGRSLSGWDANGSGVVELTSGLWKSTSAINRIDIAPYSGNYVAGSTFALYGIKG